MIYGNLKFHQKRELHPFSERYILAFLGLNENLLNQLLYYTDINENDIFADEILEALDLNLLGRPDELAAVTSRLD